MNMDTSQHDVQAFLNQGVQTINVVYCCPDQETGEVLTSDDWMGRPHLKFNVFIPRVSVRDFPRKVPRLVSPYPEISWSLSPKIFFLECSTFAEPSQISDKSCPLEVSALWFLHKITFILCLGR